MLVHIHDEGPDGDVYHFQCPRALPEGLRYVSKADLPVSPKGYRQLLRSSDGPCRIVRKALELFASVLSRADKS